MNISDTESDADLAKRAVDGEDHAFTLLMRRHKAGLFAFVRRYVGENDPALEIVQEAFVSAWKALSRYDGSRPFAVWLRAIALNKCRDRGRKLAVRRLIFGDKDIMAPEAAQYADHAPGPEALLLASQRRRVLDAAIAKLPATMKEPFLLTCFEEYSHQATADILGISIKAVESRVYRARQKLTTILGDEWI